MSDVKRTYTTEEVRAAWISLADQEIAWPAHLAPLVPAIRAGNWSVVADLIEQHGRGAGNAELAALLRG